MQAIRVASVPSSQVYIRHIGPLPGAAQEFVRLADPRPRRGDGTEQSGWWPPAMLEPGWIDEFADSFDLMHVHFGFDALTPDDLRRVAADLRRHSKPLVYTVHDLTNPHHSSPEAHDAALDVLVGCADALVTLTEGAADEVQRRWGRRPLVLPHPHVVDLDELARRQGPREASHPLRFGVHLKSLRPNMAAVPVVDAMVAGAARLGVPAVVQVNTHPEVLEDERHRELAAHLRLLDADGAISLRVHPYFNEQQLWHYLASLDASVLPYQWGTHSGWLEACADLGTAVVAPSCGYYAGQRPVFGYRHERTGLDANSLAAAMRGVAEAHGNYFRMTFDERVAERELVAAAHARLYRSLFGPGEGASS